MDLRELMHEWRIWVYILAILLSTVWIGPHYVQDNGDVKLTTNLNDKMGIDFTGGTRLLLDIQTNKTGTAQEELANKINSILEIRLTNYGLADAKIRTVDIGGKQKIQIEVANTNTTEVRSLISREGTFQARMPIRVSDATNFSLDQSYTFKKNGEEIRVTRHGDNATSFGPYEPGDRFKLGNARFIYHNVTETRANIHVVAYSGQDIMEVLTSQERVTGGTGGYSARFSVVISKEAAQRVTDVSSNYNSLSDYLKQDDGSYAKLLFYVDGKRQNALRMASVFARQTVTQPSIQTGGDTEAEARSSMRELEAIIQSGSLPAPVKVQSVSKLSSSLGDEFMTASLLSIIASLVAVGFIVFARYRDPLVAIPMIVTGASEIYILLGFWSWFPLLGNLSLAAIAGIIAAVGTGVDDQIIIADESGREKVSSWSDRMKRAFFVIFTSAASTIGAMVPILRPGLASGALGAAGLGLIGYTMYSRNTNFQYTVIGALALAISLVSSRFDPSGAALQSIHGFASTTILGIVIGISITRPAFGKIIEYIKK